MLDNQVVGSGDAIDENGDPIMLSDGSIASAFDLSDSGSDPNTGNPAALDDTGLFNDPTSITLPGSGPIVNNGASGNPPRIPGLPPIASVPISQFLNGPGPIYSGIPINANANPLSLDSGRAVTGGYTGTGVGFGEGLGDCGCPEPIDFGCEFEPDVQPEYGYETGVPSETGLPFATDITTDTPRAAEASDSLEATEVPTEIIDLEESDDITENADSGDDLVSVLERDDSQDDDEIDFEDGRKRQSFLMKMINWKNSQSSTDE